MARVICVVTGSRAEYGLLRWLMLAIKDDLSLRLQVVVTGMHLSPEFGLTYRDIEKDGFVIDRKVEMLIASDTTTAITKSMGIGLIGFAEAFEALRPDLIVILGDRFETLCAAVAASIGRIPIAHLHGGESTEGAVDEAFRHSITKMSHLHFVAAEEYRRRVIQLGEPPDRVFLVGGLGLDAINRIPMLRRNQLEESLEFRLGQRNLLVTFHPVTLETETAEQQTAELLAALEALEDTHLIFTMPNADADGRCVMEQIRSFTAVHANARAYASLGQRRYLSCLQYVDGVVGNSSSGLTEAPSFHIGTVNIGDRQRGRLRAASVIDCPPERQAISSAIRRLYSTEFRAGLRSVVNPYGESGASHKIHAVLRDHPLDNLLKKRFHDVVTQS